MKIGIDFDNTIVTYDDAMYERSLALNLISEGTNRNKKDIRDQIRQAPEGEIEWQKLQAFIYGKAMHEARLIEGVARFMQTCNERNIPVTVISHKTEYAKRDPERVNLRSAALNWMKQNKFFDSNGFNLSMDEVYFESTREEKINRVKELGCTHFIDDLLEVLEEEVFPNTIEKILFDPHQAYQFNNGMAVCHSWDEIYDYFFKK